MSSVNATFAQRVATSRAPAAGSASLEPVRAEAALDEYRVQKSLAKLA